MTIDQFCRSYCVGKTKTYSEIKSGRLKIRKLGSKTIIARADAEAWLASLPLANAV
uniref:Helix-turn-helix domain-containing protein n=2 Tax=Bradyrhizobium septentrionale TaxID=1404411 RepID=A0A973WA88_9BRAD